MAIRTTQNDLVFAGHGSYQGGAANFVLPPGVQLWQLIPTGAALTTGPMDALVGQMPIDRLLMRPADGGMRRSQDLQPLSFPKTYIAGDRVPNLVLHDLGNDRERVQRAIVRGPHHVVMVDTDTDLQTLLARDDVRTMIQSHVEARTTLRIFWSACLFQETNQGDGDRVFCNGLAVAFAATAYAARVRTDAATLAANAALDHAQLNPLDTAGTIAAAAVYDHATANQTIPL